LLWFCFTSLCDWLKNLAPLSRPIRSKTQTNQLRLARTRTFFPALCASNTYLLRVLIGSLDNLCLLWLAGVITLVLVLWHSFEKRSKKQELYLGPSQDAQKVCTVTKGGTVLNVPRYYPPKWTPTILICKGLHSFSNFGSWGNLDCTKKWSNVFCGRFDQDTRLDEPAWWSNSFQVSLKVGSKSSSISEDKIWVLALMASVGSVGWLEILMTKLYAASVLTPLSSLILVVCRTQFRY